MPVDLAAVIEVLVAEQAETMAADLIRLAEDSSSLFGQMCAQHASALGNLAASEKETALA